VVLPELVLRGDVDPVVDSFDVGYDARVVIPPEMAPYLRRAHRRPR
jgi:hypothetical protein